MSVSPRVYPKLVHCYKQFSPCATVVYHILTAHALMAAHTHSQPFPENCTNATFHLAVHCSICTIHFNSFIIDDVTQV